ncbi:MAG: hypothetical protein OXC82_11185, partial [Rhodobacteraceae bacterium]|nr:hypothetical protein [Paracoccaceae bacterium]
YFCRDPIQMPWELLGMVTLFFQWRTLLTFPQTARWYQTLQRARNRRNHRKTLHQIGLNPT